MLMQDRLAVETAAVFLPDMEILAVWYCVCRCTGNSMLCIMYEITQDNYKAEQ